MSDRGLMIRDDHVGLVDFSIEAVALRDEALEKSALIGKVTNAEEQARAVEAQVALHTVSLGVEKARKECKEPVLLFGKRIDDTAKKFIEEVKTEELRIARLIGDFQQLEQARVRAEEQARNAKLAEMEREKARAMTEAKSHEQMDAIAEHFNQKAAEVPVPVVEKAQGQVATQDWEVEVTDAALLFRAYPHCVKMVPVLTEIKALLKAGLKPPGVMATPIVRAGVRLGAARKAIEV